ncbi:hypothetical protein AX15_004091 [Amanita polypyramis BW_CC]|nr:hypothetical protein AX15_004091 [Amanita polypyramis BW_CC]
MLPSTTPRSSRKYKHSNVETPESSEISTSTSPARKRRCEENDTPEASALLEHKCIEPSMPIVPLSTRKYKREDDSDGTTPSTSVPPRKRRRRDESFKDSVLPSLRHELQDVLTLCHWKSPGQEM